MCLQMLVYVVVQLVEEFERYVVACLDLTEQFIARYSPVSTVSRYRVVIKVVFTSQHN